MTVPIIPNKLIKAEANTLGFDVCGLARAETVNEETQTFMEQWLQSGKQAEMAYLNRNFDKRCNPKLLVEDACTVISVALNYYPSQFIRPEEYQIAWYTYGQDYHEVIRHKLQKLLLRLQEYYPTLSGRAFCDTGSVLERYWAWKAGLGWIGKNTQLIIPHAGSCFFLGELFINAQADIYDQEQPNRCGNCSQCLEICPTGALEAPYTLNANRCISYLTIENKGEISPQFTSSIKDTIYGCDYCQKVCPWNRFATPCKTPELQPNEKVLEMKKTDWETLTEEKYKELFADSAIKRAKYSGLIRNINTAKRTGRSQQFNKHFDK